MRCTCVAANAALLAAILALVSGTAGADSLVLLGAGGAYVSQETEARQPWDAEAAGLSALSWVDVAPNVGACAAAAVGFVAGSHADGAALDVGAYQTFSLHALLGVGVKASFDPLTALASAGLYLGSTALDSQNASLSSFEAGGVGAGVGVSLLYALNGNWGIGVNVNAAYYFAVPGSTTSTMASSGFCAFGGIGVAYFFRPEPNLGPGVKPF